MSELDWLAEQSPFATCSEAESAIEFSTVPLPVSGPKRPPRHRRHKQPKRKSPKDLTNKQWQTHSICMQEYLVTEALKRPQHNLARRHTQSSTASALTAYELSLLSCSGGVSEGTDLRGVDLPLEYFKCYGCGQCTQVLHANYIFSCVACGDLFQSKRHQTRSLVHHWALVTGGRTKLGYQIVLKLLRAGADCVATTRVPERALAQYRAEPDSQEWLHRLHMYPKPLDFTSTSLSEELGVLYEYLASRTSHLDVLVNCAAQTIQGFNAHLEGTTTGQTNRYGDPARYREGKSSWNLEFHEVSYAEWVSVFAVNAIAPPMLTSQMLPLLQGRNHDPAQGELPPAAYLLNVHAREGVFEVRKSKFHVHTNMAKAALAMFTKCVSRYKLLDSGHRRIFVHGIDPGWISTDEYHAGVSPWVISPIDEVDGAARVLQPVWEQLKSKQKTRRHFYNLLY